MADLSIEVVIGITIGAVVVVIGLGALIVYLTTRGRAKRDSQNLREFPGISSKLSTRRQVINISGKFEPGYSFDVTDVLPPRASNEAETHDSVVFNADANRPPSDVRASYDRPYSFRQRGPPGPSEVNIVGGYGAVSMYSTGRIPSSVYSVDSMNSDFVTSQTLLLPTSQGLRDPANRPPVPIPGGPYIIHVDQRELAPVSGKPYNHNNRPDSFRASKSVDLGAQPEKAWMLSSLEKEKFPSPRRF